MLLLVFLSALVAVVTLFAMLYVQDKMIQRLNNDILAAGKSIESLKAESTGSYITPVDLDSFNKTLRELEANHQLPPVKPSETRKALMDELSILRDKVNGLRHEKDQADLLLSMMTSEISGNRQTRTELAEERGILLSRIQNLETNLEFQTKKNSTLVSSLHNVLERISGVVGLPVLLDSDAAITADVMANRLQTIFTTHSEILHRLTSETNKATLRARDIIERAGFDPAKVIELPFDLDSSFYEESSQPDASNALSRLLPLVLDNDYTLTKHDLSDTGIASADLQKQNALIARLQDVHPFGKDGDGGDAFGRGGPFIPAELVLDDTGSSGDIFTSNLFSLSYAMNLYDATDAFVACMPLAKPIESGRLTSKYGYRRDPIVKNKLAFHAGLDIANKIGTPVMTGGAGRVIYANWAGAFGRVVTIDHGCGFSTRYAHLKKIFVNAGDIIEDKQAIGTMGSSGRSTGSHLHYELMYHGRHYNPINILRIEHDLW